MVEIRQRFHEELRTLEGEVQQTGAQARLLGEDWWLLDVQAHDQTAPQPGPDLEVNSSVGEDGQLLAIRIPHST